MSSGTGAAGVHFARGHSTCLATNATFRLSVCWPIFLVRQATATEETVLRDVVIEMPEGCDAATLQSAGINSAHQNVRSRGCSDTYTSSDRLQVGVCHANALCVESTFSAEQLTGLYCTCRGPAYPNPSLAPSYAPYEAKDGCLIPRRLDKALYESSGIQRSLQKPHSTTVSLNLSLRMTGDDGVVTTWRVVNADVLKTFIQLPSSSGNISAETDVIQIPLVLTASGRRERAQVYEDSLIVVVSSPAIQRVAEVCASHLSVGMAFACKNADHREIFSECHQPILHFHNLHLRVDM